MANNVICWIELEDGQPTSSSLELLGEAAELAQGWDSQLFGVILTSNITNVQSWAALTGSFGCNNLLIANHQLLASYSCDGFVLALSQVLKDEEWVTFLTPSSATASDFVARLAARMNVEMLSECVRLSPTKPGSMTLTRPVYSDRLYNHYLFEAGSSHNPAKIIATFRPGSRGLNLRPVGKPANVRYVQLDIDSSDIRTSAASIIPPEPDSIDLVEAERIVAVGLGLPHPLGVQLAKELAESLHAAVGATRPVVDKGWLPFERQIGTTGRTVAPDLYFALGISGASQHAGGIREAKTIIAINTDRSAPLMAMSDLAIVGDASEIVPLLLSLLKAKSGKNEANHETQQSNYEILSISAS